MLISRDDIYHLSSLTQQLITSRSLALDTYTSLINLRVDTPSSLKVVPTSLLQALLLIFNCFVKCLFKFRAIAFINN